MGIPTEIADLICEKDSDVATNFLGFIKEIFACTKDDISTLCQSIENEKLLDIRSRLFESLIEQQSYLRGAKLCNRR